MAHHIYGGEEEALCTHMVAFTFGNDRNGGPANGGTKMTWDMAAGKLRVHVSLSGV